MGLWRTLFISVGKKAVNEASSFLPFEKLFRKKIPCNIDIIILSVENKHEKDGIFNIQTFSIDRLGFLVLNRCRTWHLFYQISVTASLCAVCVLWFLYIFSLFYSPYLVSLYSAFYFLFLNWCTSRTFQSLIVPFLRHANAFYVIVLELILHS